jgi:hypothetical protein
MPTLVIHVDVFVRNRGIKVTYGAAKAANRLGSDEILMSDENRFVSRQAEASFCRMKPATQPAARTA